MTYAAAARAGRRIQKRKALATGMKYSGIDRARAAQPRSPPATRNRKAEVVCASGGSAANPATSRGMCSASCMKTIVPTIDGAQMAQIVAAINPARSECTRRAVMNSNGQQAAESIACTTNARSWR